jgi:CheY-like chemotaxis protein
MSPLLYVDDDDNDLVLLQSAFKRAGIANPLHVATDGEMAIDYLAGAGPFADRRQHPLPGLVLLDLKLPKKNGLEVLEWIRSQAACKTLVVIVFTSSPNASDIGRAYELGANSFVIKPPEIQQLTELARRLKTWWLECNQFAPPLPVPSPRAS